MSFCKIDFEKEWALKYQGAESKIYFGTHSNRPCVIKHRFPKKYRHPILDKKLTKERTKRERRMIEKIETHSKILSSHMPRVIWSNESTILMTEMTNCETLYDYIERCEPGEIPSVLEMIGQCVAELHNLGIIHGDLTTSNLLLMPRGRDSIEIMPAKKIKSQDIRDSKIVVPIDFGLSTGSNHPEERAVDLYVLERALLSTHFPDSHLFNILLDSYLKHLNEPTTSEINGKQKVMERLREVRARGRKSEYTGE